MPAHKPSAAAPSPTKRPANRPPHVPSETDRATVSVMAAAGVAQSDIAHAHGLSTVTLRKHYRAELDAGTAQLNSEVILEHLKAIRRGDFAAIKWWEQSRMGWTERVVVDNPNADKPLRVVIEFVGGQPPHTQPTVPVIEAKPVQPASRLPDAVVEFKGSEP